MSLTEIILQKIRKKGSVSFHDFMETALYYPQKGYYCCGKHRTGRHGDFYTGCQLTPAYGEAIGRQLEEMWEKMGGAEFTIVEYGAGGGELCDDILAYLQSNQLLYKGLQYCIIEKNTAMQESPRKRNCEKVRLINGLEEISGFSGCILSNELIDNFAVHQVVMQEKLMEVFIEYEYGFREVLKPARKMLQDYFSELNVILPEGYRTEVNLHAIRWIQEIASHMMKGYVLTIDYGYCSHELYNKNRSGGTLLSYRRHKISENIYEDIGQQDITSHVNFSALCHWGFKHGLVCCGITSQTSFLLALGFKESLRRMVASDLKQDVLQQAVKESLLTHSLLLDMGHRFKVLIQRKGGTSNSLKGLTLSCQQQISAYKI